MMQKPKKVKSLRLSRSMDRKVTQIAKRTGKTWSGFVVECIKEALARAEAA